MVSGFDALALVALVALVDTCLILGIFVVVLIVSSFLVCNLIKCASFRSYSSSALTLPLHVSQPMHWYNHIFDAILLFLVCLLV